MKKTYLALILLAVITESMAFDFGKAEQTYQGESSSSKIEACKEATDKGRGIISHCVFRKGDVKLSSCSCETVDDGRRHICLVDAAVKCDNR